MTQEQGKVLAEARGEVLVTADIIEWFAEEGRRAYGRIVPGRGKGVRQLVMQEPVGVVRGLHAVEFPDAHAGAQDRRVRSRPAARSSSRRRRRRRAAASSWCAASSMPACRRACSISCSACRRKCRSI